MRSAIQFGEKIGIVSRKKEVVMVAKSNVLSYAQGEGIFFS